MAKDCAPEKELTSALNVISPAHLQGCSKTPPPRSPAQHDKNKSIFRHYEDGTEGQITTNSTCLEHRARRNELIQSRRPNNDSRKNFP